MGTHPIFESDFDCLTEMRTTLTKSAQALVQANASTQVYSSGITAIALPASSPACQVAVSIKAGAANESASNIGAATFTRYTVGLSNYRNTATLQQRMVNLMGGEFETFGNRERTVVSISAGPKAIEELATDVLVPSINQPLFLKYEMFHPWSQAKAAGACPVDNAFHQASFTGGLSNANGFTGGYGSESPAMLEERDEILENLARNFHHSHYGTKDMIVVGSGVSESFLQKIVTQLQENNFSNNAGVASSFYAGQVRIARPGASVAVVGINATGTDSAVASVVAAGLGGKVISYAGNQVIQFSANSPAELSSKLGSLAAFDVASALNNASLAQAVQLGSGDKAKVAAVATGQVSDVSGVIADEVSAFAAEAAASAKSLVVLGDVHAFPQNFEI